MRSPSARRRLRVLLTLAALVVPLASLYVHGRPGGGTSPVERALTGATSPLQRLAGSIVASVRGLFSGYIALVGVRAENERLRRDNRTLLAQAMAVRRVTEENARLRRLLDLRQRMPATETLAARVVGKDVSSFYRVVRIYLDAGSADGIRKGLPVIAPDGVVGRIVRVGGNYAEVMLAVDPRSRIHAKVDGKGVLGIIRGKPTSTAAYTARFRFLDKGKPLEPGDAVVTSGYDRAFPPGVVIGYIADEPMRQDGVYYEYEVVPAVNFSTLEEVLVVTRWAGLPQEAGGGTGGGR